MNSIADFHFLRPLWLWALLPASGLLWVLWSQRSEQAWQRLIAPHLLDALWVRSGEPESKIRPWMWLAFFWLLSTLAVAGPSWKREPSPFADEQSAIVLAIYLGPTMDAEDIQPTRLKRAAYKIRDLLRLRPGAPTALIAYAGTAHTVLPFTTDHRLIEQMAEELSTDIMPVEGNAVADAARLASRMLEAAGGPGQLLLLTDSIPPDAIESLSNTGVRGQILAIAAPRERPAPTSGPAAPALDRATFARAANAIGGSFVEISPDDFDIEELDYRLDRTLSLGSSPERARWHDAGYGLVFPIAMTLLLGFRRGWGIQWQG